MIKIIDKKNPTADIVNGEKLSFPIKIRYKTRMSPLITLFKHYTESLYCFNKARKKKHKTAIGKDDIKLLQMA